MVGEKMSSCSPKRPMEKLSSRSSSWTWSAGGGAILSEAVDGKQARRKLERAAAATGYAWPVHMSSAEQESSDSSSSRSTLMLLETVPPSSPSSLLLIDSGGFEVNAAGASPRSNPSTRGLSCHFVVLFVPPSSHTRVQSLLGCTAPVPVKLGWVSGGERESMKSRNQLTTFSKTAADSAC